MRIWISGGGTAGHVYPALTVLAASSAETVEATWLGRPGSMEERIALRQGLPFTPLAAAHVVGVGARGLAASGLALARGTVRAWRLIGAHPPDVAFVTGGYVSVPLALAAWLRRVPLAVYLPDVAPGMAVRWIARLADAVCVTTDSARDHLPAGRCVVTGYPVREGLRRADRETSRQRLGIGAADAAVLVVGGSQGARRLNRAVIGSCEVLLRRAFVIHSVGERDLDEVRARRASLPPDLGARWHVHGYLEETAMADALAAADVVVCRSGAATLGELPARALPAVLVPLPIAGGHQSDNASVLVRAGAAVAVPDESFDGERLLAEVLPLLEDEDRRRRMADAARALDRPRAAADIFAVLARLARRGEVTDG